MTVTQACWQKLPVDGISQLIQVSNAFCKACSLQCRWVGLQSVNQQGNKCSESILPLLTGKQHHQGYREWSIECMPKILNPTVMNT